MDKRQAYRVLELEYGSDTDKIKSAYRRLALESHPDKNSGNDKKFKMVTEAYDLLRDAAPPKTDRVGAQKSRPQSPWGAPKGAPPEQDWSKFTKEFEDSEWWAEYEKKFWEDYNKTVNADGHNGEFDKTREPDKQPNLFVNVDQTLCIGCCSCEIIAPSVFHVDKKSYTNPKSSVIDQRGAGVNKIMNAAETCPTKAINVLEMATGQRLFPH